MPARKVVSAGVASVGSLIASCPRSERGGLDDNATSAKLRRRTSARTSREPCIVSGGHSKHGGLASTGKAVDLKSTGPRGPWGFESLALRHFSSIYTALQFSSGWSALLCLAI